MSYGDNKNAYYEMLQYLNLHRNDIFTLATELKKLFCNCPQTSGSIFVSHNRDVIISAELMASSFLVDHKKSGGYYKVFPQVIGEFVGGLVDDGLGKNSTFFFVKNQFDFLNYLEKKSSIFENSTYNELSFMIVQSFIMIGYYDAALPVESEEFKTIFMATAAFGDATGRYDLSENETTDSSQSTNESETTEKGSSPTLRDILGALVALALVLLCIFGWILHITDDGSYEVLSYPIEAAEETNVETGITTDSIDIGDFKSFTTNSGVHAALIVFGIVLCLASAATIAYLLLSKKERKNVLPFGIATGACLIIGFGLLIGSAFVKSDTLYYKDNCISVNFIEIYKAGDRISADVEIVNGFNKSVRNIVLSNVILTDENGNVYAKADILKYDSVFLSGYRDHSYAGFYAIPVNDNVTIPDKTYVYYEYSYE